MEKVVNPQQNIIPRRTA